MSIDKNLVEGENMAKIKQIKESELFKDFSDKEIAVISQIVSERKFPANTPIFVENMLGESLFLIKSGTIEISKNIPQIGETKFLTIGAGEFFGEMAVLDGGSRLVSAKVTEEAELLIMSGDAFKTLSESEPMVCLKMLLSIIKITTKRFRENIANFDEFMAWKLGYKK